MVHLGPAPTHQRMGCGCFRLALFTSPRLNDCLEVWVEADSASLAGFLTFLQGGKPPDLPASLVSLRR